MIRLHGAHSLRDEKLLINETKKLSGGNTINVVFGSNEPEVTPFDFLYKRRGMSLCYDRNGISVTLLVRHERIVLEGPNTQD